MIYTMPVVGEENQIKPQLHTLSRNDEADLGISVRGL